MKASLLFKYVTSTGIAMLSRAENEANSIDSPASRLSEVVRLANRTGDKWPTFPFS